MAKRIGCSPLSGTIYSGTTRMDKKGNEMWVTKTDVTDEAIKAVFQHMYEMASKTGVYSIQYKGFGVMSMVREQPQEVENE